MLTIISAATVFLVGYARRNRIVAWFRRAINAPPSFESQPSFSANQDDTKLAVTNHGPGEAFDVRCAITWADRLQGLDFIGPYNFDSIGKDDHVVLAFAVEGGRPSGTATIEVSWILRQDSDSDPERASKSFSLDGRKF